MSACELQSQCLTGDVSTCRQGNTGHDFRVGQQVRRGEGLKHWKVLHNWKLQLQPVLQTAVWAVYRQERPTWCRITTARSGHLVRPSIWWSGKKTKCFIKYYSGSVTIFHLKPLTPSDPDCQGAPHDSSLHGWNQEQHFVNMLPTIMKLVKC